MPSIEVSVCEHVCVCVWMKSATMTMDNGPAPSKNSNTAYMLPSKNCHIQFARALLLLNFSIWARVTRANHLWKQTNERANDSISWRRRPTSIRSHGKYRAHRLNSSCLARTILHLPPHTRFLAQSNSFVPLTILFFRSLSVYRALRSGFFTTTAATYRYEESVRFYFKQILLSNLLTVNWVESHSSLLCVCSNEHVVLLLMLLPSLSLAGWLVGCLADWLPQKNVENIKNTQQYIHSQTYY